MALPLVMPRTWLSLVPSCSDPAPTPLKAPSGSSSPVVVLPPFSSTTPKPSAPAIVPSTARSAAKAAFERANHPRRRTPFLWTFVPLLPSSEPVNQSAPEGKGGKPSTSSILGKRTRDEFDMRPMQACDVPAVRQLHELTLPVPYSSSYFFSLLSNPQQLCLVATLPSHPSSQSYFDLPHSQSSSASSSGGGPSSPQRSPKITSALSGKARVSRRIIGCVSARLAFEGADDGSLSQRRKAGPKVPGVRILTLCVDPTYRRTGVGSALLDKVLESMASLARIFRPSPLTPPTAPDHSKVSVSLHVQAPNAVAKRFYERNGFTAGSLKSNYYAALRLKPLDSALRAESHAGKSKDRVRDVDAWYLEKQVA